MFLQNKATSGVILEFYQKETDIVQICLVVRSPAMRV